MAKSPRLEFESMSDGDIREVIEQAREALSDRFTNRVDELRALASEAGYEVLITRRGEGEGRTRRAKSTGTEGGDRRSSVRPKYRNPENHSETWTGRGREPRWMAELIRRGRKREDMLISHDGGEQKEAHETSEPEAA
jgi:DNA-binding protein H-NS